MHFAVLSFAYHLLSYLKKETFVCNSGLYLDVEVNVIYSFSFLDFLN